MILHVQSVYAVASTADSRHETGYEKETRKARTDLSGHGETLRISDGGQLFVPQALDGVLIVPQIQFGSHQNDGCVGTVMTHFRIPLHTHTQFT